MKRGKFRLFENQIKLFLFANGFDFSVESIEKKLENIVYLCVQVLYEETC